MSISSSMSISASGLSAERLRMDVIAGNLANADTAVTAGGEPFRRKIVVYQTCADGGVQASGIVNDPSPFREEYNPGHPLADAKTGIVRLPNINIVSEMVDLISATRAYEANITAFNAAKSMVQRALEMSKV